MGEEEGVLGVHGALDGEAVLGVVGLAVSAVFVNARKEGKLFRLKTTAFFMGRGLLVQ